MAAPVPQEVTGEQERGRGLLIVAMVSARWGWLLAPQGGKVVWAELPIPAGTGHVCLSSRPISRASVEMRQDR